ncbi:hypothetical protein CSC2_22460 [Clostridium zeae]|uniref:Uncharacterized protein n=1 Tax=Clostridium zeae TaxID=2759022 RepID=A0ABQ1EAB6_9CLOT|nr:hypothetical protein CSC2_22460 [Clostridium zeae]
MTIIILVVTAKISWIYKMNPAYFFLNKKTLRLRYYKNFSYDLMFVIIKEFLNAKLI